MHAKAIEIAWHDHSSIWSLHLSPENRLVTAGGDKVARIWKIHSDPHSLISTPTNSHPQPTSSQPVVEWLCDLRAHTTTVNIARFTHDGSSIATGADQGEIVLWTLEQPYQHPQQQQSQHPLPLGMQDLGKERWTRQATLRAHVQDVLDLAWSCDASKLVSASVDNAIMIWDVKNPSKTPVTLRNHANFVQGVCIDPFSRLIASLGNDRTFRVFTTSNANNWYQVAHVSNMQDAKLFMDDSRFKNCFRRLAWSPDGSVVACPSGVHFPPAKRQFAVHIFARNQWFQPAAQCGGMTKPAVAARFSPVLYELRRNTRSAEGVQPHIAPSPFAKFTYRMILAVLCADRVLFYDTECFQRPFASVKGLHIAEHTDLAWSDDGQTLAVSSSDGYVGLVCFAPGELGDKLSTKNTPPWLQRQEQVCTPFRSTSKSSQRTTVTLVRPMPSRSSDRSPSRAAELQQRPASPPRELPSAHNGNVPHPKSILSTVGPTQPLQDPAGAASKSSTTAQGFRISMKRPADVTASVQNKSCDHSKLETYSSPVADHSSTRESRAEDEKKTEIVSNDLQGPRPSSSCAPSIGQNQGPSGPGESKMNYETSAIQSEKGEVSTTPQGREKQMCNQSAGSCIPADEKCVRTTVVNSSGKEISADPEASVKHKVITKSKPTQPASMLQEMTDSKRRFFSAARSKSSESSSKTEAPTPKRRTKTKQVQMTLMAFQSSSSTTSTPHPTPNAQRESVGVNASPQKRRLAERSIPAQASKPPRGENNGSGGDHIQTSDDEQRKRRKQTPSEVIEIV
ncbi:Chromatin assembly factor 1 subunit B [Gracilariopsis chorda]|uniref:Chromatin assembly factor 1 subunit B n=1 Tax=Gracilariopsis chorda TaxID=448386 RepID=A0A2V3IZY4_9FLOR|nr:Chromatin assembly factor 1 subunit B [Gracilariopsis chorda]|eukprot:PXF47613.1 Chromatin assembly factor 1 subunit B [Gracilariopsis chorda]